MLLKRVFLWYAMLCYLMLWYGMESMLCYEISMVCYEIFMLCYAMVYVVKDKHSATVFVLCYGMSKRYLNVYNNLMFYTIHWSLKFLDNEID